MIEIITEDFFYEYYIYIVKTNKIRFSISEKIYTDYVSKLGFQTRRRPEFLSDMVGAEAVQLK